MRDNRSAAGCRTCAVGRAGSRCQLSDVLGPEVFDDRRLERGPQLHPLVVCELREGDALRNAHLVALHVHDIVVTGQNAQFVVDAVLIAWRVLVLADSAAHAEVHPVHRQAARAHDLDLHALAVAEFSQERAALVVSRDQADLVVALYFGKPQLHFPASTHRVHTNPRFHARHPSVTDLYCPHARQSRLWRMIGDGAWLMQPSTSGPPQLRRPLRTRIATVPAHTSGSLSRIPRDTPGRRNTAGRRAYDHRS